jgi:hypothetical protein
MKHVLMICVIGMSFLFGACAHKCDSGCKDGSCKMEKSCGDCAHKHDHAEKPKTEEKK